MDGVDGLVSEPASAAFLLSLLYGPLCVRFHRPIRLTRQVPDVQPKNGTDRKPLSTPKINVVPEHHSYMQHMYMTDQPTNPQFLFSPWSCTEMEYCNREGMGPCL